MNLTWSKAALMLFAAVMPFGGTAIAANPSWAVVEPPPAILDSPIYVYACSDSTCASQSQLEDNGYVTRVPTWQNLQPATWVFLETGGTDKYYALWKADGSNWTTCTLHLEPSGDVGASNTCPGAVKIAESSSADVSKISLGAAAFPGSAAGPVAPQPYNPLNARSITLSNESKASGVCVQTDSTFAHTLCSGAHVHDIAQSPFARTIPQNGDDSKAAQVIGIQYRATPPWTATGKDPRSQQVYATKVEWTAFPTEASNPNSGIPAGNTDHTIGPTTIDVSLVDGFNVGIELVPDQDTVCAVSEFETGPLVFKLFLGGSPMAEFPTSLRTPEDDICPTGYAVLVGTIQTGCYSQCSWANATGRSQTEIDKNCCKGSSYDTFATCNPVIDKSYIDNVVANSEGVYTWAYNDFRGTYTCDGTASFSFRVTDVFDRLPSRVRVLAR